MAGGWEEPGSETGNRRRRGAIRYRVESNTTLPFASRADLKRIAACSIILRAEHT
jgi:hypothetical protein